MKNEIQPRYGVTSQVILGVMVITIGLVFLLDTLDIIDTHRAFSFWPLFFIAIGTVKIIDSKSSGGRLAGAALVAWGGLLALDRMDIIRFNWAVVWPLLLIGFGAVVVAKAIRGRRMVECAGLKEGVHDHDVVDVTAIIAAVQRRVTTQHFRGGEITAVMGGCSLDLRNAAIDKEAVLNVFAFWGGVTLKCPPDWSIVMEGTPLMGGFEDKTMTPPEGAKRLVIRGYAIMGGVEVRN